MYYTLRCQISYRRENNIQNSDESDNFQNAIQTAISKILYSFGEVPS